jgi:hypothetical protein
MRGKNHGVMTIRSVLQDEPDAQENQTGLESGDAVDTSEKAQK